MTGNEGEPRPRFDTATGRRIVGYDPKTGAPVLETAPSSRQRFWDNNNMIAAIGVGVVLVVVAILLIGNSGGGSGHQLTGVVHGNMVGAGNIGSGNALAWSHIYCGWEGDHVEVHADLTDGVPSDPVQTVVEDVTVSPIYTIRWSDGSEHRHGDGIGSILDVSVPAGKTVS